MARPLAYSLKQRRFLSDVFVRSKLFSKEEMSEFIKTRVNLLRTEGSKFFHNKIMSGFTIFLSINMQSTVAQLVEC